MSYHHGNLKEMLIQAGDIALKSQGIEALSLREIAKRAGVSHNAPYRHFRDKNDLIQQVIERTINEMAEQILNAPLLYPISVLMQMQFVGRLWAQLATRHPRKAHLIFSGQQQNQNNEQNKLVKNGLRLLRVNIECLLNEALGKELAAETDVQKLAIIFIATFRGLGIQYITQEVPDILINDEDLYGYTDIAVENILRSTLV